MAREAGAGKAPGRRLRLPERIPDFGPRSLLLFQLIWFPLFLLAVLGPAAGTWYRFSAASQNSALVPGSRAGVALSEADLTRIRFPVGPAAASAGVRPGDDIVEIDGIRLSDAVPMPGRSGAGTETDYALLGELLYGTEDRDMLLRLRSPGGAERDVPVRTGEFHLETAAKGLGLSPRLLSFADLLHLLTYPFLLASAWVLCRRRKKDVISSVVSLAIVLTLVAEQPSASFLALVAGIPDAVHRTLYDLANTFLLAGILLFPHGRLSPRPVLALVASLPLLFLLGGDSYRIAFILYMGASVATLVWRLSGRPPGDERQQLKWALFGFAGYALFLAASLVADMMKGEAGSLATQLAMEVAAGLAFGIAFLLLQLGLLVALLKYRLYDAEAVITRSASIALITLVLGAVFAATMEAVKEVVLAAFGRDAGSMAPIVGAAISTVLVSPAYERVQRWTEGRLHRHLAALRQELPECLRDLRHFASLRDLVSETLDRLERGVRPTRIAALVEGRLVEARGASPDEVEAWLAEHRPDPARDLDFDPAGGLFPIRLPLRAEGGAPLGWILFGPRPDRSCVSTAERDTLIETAPPIARAVRVVLRREARERDLAETLARHERRIDSLAARLSIDPAPSRA
jgi:hypothetical protein